MTTYRFDLLRFRGDGNWQFPYGLTILHHRADIDGEQYDYLYRDVHLGGQIGISRHFDDVND